MLKFTKVAAQGELTIKRVQRLPEDAGAPVAPERGVLIVGHSETGHHHVMERPGAQFFEPVKQPDGMTVLFAILTSANELTHLRGYDTHETIAFQPGMYEFRSGREFDPYAELARKQMD